MVRASDTGLAADQRLHEPQSHALQVHEPWPGHPAGHMSCAFGACIGDFVAEWPTATAATRATPAMSR
jgi:hypothetical protein